jgi:RimJ/RimL family protein N-acetyltransferase
MIQKLNWVSETERFHLRELNIFDAENFYHLNSDPEVMKFTGDKPFETIDEAAKFLETYNPYAIAGFGRWALISKTNHEFVGWCGLKRNMHNQEVDVGYRIFRKHWNKGIATETAYHSLQLGFNKFKLSEIVGNVMKENHVSINVLQKIGMTLYKERTCGDQPGLVFRITPHKMRIQP